LVLKAVEPTRTPTIPVMISFYMAKGGDSNGFRMPPHFELLINKVSALNYFHTIPPLKALLAW
jgi:hypothetical protein